MIMRIKITLISLLIGLILIQIINNILKNFHLAEMKIGDKKVNTYTFITTMKPNTGLQIPSDLDKQETRITTQSHVVNISPVSSHRDYWETSNKTRPILEIINFGRMGNRLFHYAVTYCTALQTHRTPTIGKDSYLFKLFPNLSAKKLNITYLVHLNNFDFDERYRISSKGWSKFNPDIHKEVRVSNSTWLRGCFQSWKYLIGCENPLRREFTFNLELQEKVNKQMRAFAIDYMVKNNIVFYDITFIGIHVRLGDMLFNQQMSVGYTHAPPSYFKNAMNYYDKRYRWPLYIAASEDIQWCKDNIKSPQNNLYFSNYGHRDFMLDFIMLSLCNHSIITVGSYGWFTAWMANGEVVYYNKFPVPGSHLAHGFSYSDKYPLTWIGMS